jgi:hypothetical protein
VTRRRGTVALGEERLVGGQGVVGEVEGGEDLHRRLLDEPSEVLGARSSEDLEARGLAAAIALDVDAIEGEDVEMWVEAERGVAPAG